MEFHIFYLTTEETQYFDRIINLRHNEVGFNLNDLHLYFYSSFYYKPNAIFYLNIINDTFTTIYKAHGVVKRTRIIAHI